MKRLSGYTSTISRPTAAPKSGNVPAVRQALKSVQDTSRLQQIVLPTDGQVGNEDELFELPTKRNYEAIFHGRHRVGAQ
ncbi:MAG: hypothetical protein U0361_17390 [Nitrospiraceae bacterium]